MDIDHIRERYGVDITESEVRHHQTLVEAALLGIDRAEVLRLTGRLADTPFPLAFIYIEIIQPVLYKFGEQWARGELSSMRIHIATSLVNSMLTLLYQRRVIDVPQDKAPIMVCNVPENLHEIGSRMLADLLEEAHYPVIYLSPPIEYVSMLDFVFAKHPQVIAFSAVLPEHIIELWAIAETLRRGGYTGKIAAGGYALHNHNNHLWQAYGINWTGTDPLAFIHWLSETA